MTRRSRGGRRVDRGGDVERAEPTESRAPEPSEPLHRKEVDRGKVVLPLVEFREVVSSYTPQVAVVSLASLQDFGSFCADTAQVVSPVPHDVVNDLELGMELLGQIHLPMVWQSYVLTHAETIDVARRLGWDEITIMWRNDLTNDEARLLFLTASSQLPGEFWGHTNRIREKHSQAISAMNERALHTNPLSINSERESASLVVTTTSRADADTTRLVNREDTTSQMGVDPTALTQGKSLSSPPDTQPKKRKLRPAN